MYSTVERLDDCEYSLEIIIVPLKEHVTETNFCLKTNILLLKELLKQWTTARSPVKINTAFFKKIG